MTNKSLNVFLYNKDARAVDVCYDIETPVTDQKAYTVKTVIPDLKEGELVMIPTSSRDGFTVVKVIELDTEEKLDFDSNRISYVWIAGRFDRSYYDELIAAEKASESIVRKADHHRRVKELADNLPQEVKEKLASSGNLLYNPMKAIGNGDPVPPPAPEVGNAEPIREEHHIRKATEDDIDF